MKPSAGYQSAINTTKIECEQEHALRNATVIAFLKMAGLAKLVCCERRFCWVK